MSPCGYSIVCELLRLRSDCDDDDVCGKNLSVGGEGDCVGVDSSAPGAQLARCLHPRLVYSVQCTVVYLGYTMYRCPT